MSNEQRYYDALRRIARDYCSVETLKRSAERRYGVTPSEAVEMAYENLQAEALSAIHGKRRPKGPKPQENPEKG